MTAPQDNRTAEDELVQRTNNGLRPDDPTEQPPQDPDWLPPGTATGEDQ